MSTSTPISAPLREALNLLLKADAYARDVDVSRWAFAVEIDRLLSVGVTHCDLRWLLHKGVISHAVEATSPIGSSRTYSLEGSAVFSKGSCFCLTADGRRFADLAKVNGSGIIIEMGSANNPSGNGHATFDQPVWDAQRQELTFGGVVVKRFKVPAPNQELVLASFQEEGWPVRIDDPLPPRPEIDSKRRLQDTITSLNRCQVHKLIAFHGDGHGVGVKWEAISAALPEPMSR
jgi:hypothetical protein